MGSGCSTSSSTKHGKTEVITVKAAPNEPPPSQEPVETATAPPVAEIDPSKAAKLGVKASIASTDDLYKSRPMLNECFTFIAGKKLPFGGEVTEVTSPIVDENGERIRIGKVPSLTAAEALDAAKAAAKAWDQGQGTWPQMSLESRIAAVERFIELLQNVRDEIVNAVMWEICKNTTDAAAEFDRTMTFVKGAIEKLKVADESLPFGSWTSISGTRARVRRGPVGVTLMLAPFNYPLNEMYSMLIPALLMGNTVVLKLPAVGGLAHILTMDALSRALPEGVVNFVTGSGRKTMGPIMESGIPDAIGFIGGAKATDALIKQHPHPHRLKVTAQLEGKNVAIVLPDADLDVAAKQIVTGSLSYNGQRCTALKLVMAHSSVVDPLLEKVVDGIKALKKGLPQDGCNITPLPEPQKPGYLTELVTDAVAKGAKVVNVDDGGGECVGNLFMPALLYPVTSEMRVFNEEQFGPVVPIASFTNNSDVITALKNSKFGQQASIFTKCGVSAAPLVDAISSIVGRVNLNAQCSRGPDAFPFSGRRSSAMGTMSVTEALLAFSIEVVIAHPDTDENKAIAEALEGAAEFLKPIVPPM